MPEPPSDHSNSALHAAVNAGLDRAWDASDGSIEQHEQVAAVVAAIEEAGLLGRPLATKADDDAYAAFVQGIRSSKHTVQQIAINGEWTRHYEVIHVEGERLAVVEVKHVE